jgi:hypothetical protein
MKRKSKLKTRKAKSLKRGSQDSSDSLERLVRPKPSWEHEQRVEKLSGALATIVDELIEVELGSMVLGYLAEHMLRLRSNDGSSATNTGGNKHG